MLTTAPVAYGVLAFMALVILVVFAVVFARRTDMPKPAERARPPMPVAWPIWAEPSSSHALLGGPNRQAGHGPESVR